MEALLAPLSWDLGRWMALDAERRRELLSALFAERKAHLGFAGELSFVMPEGFQGAYGVYDNLSNVLHISSELLAEDGVPMPFTFCHEFRHLLQFQFPEAFSPFLAESLRYALQYDGLAFLFEEGKTRSVRLEGAPDYFLDLYLAQPMELDANGYALDCLSGAAGAEPFRRELHQWADMWRPKYRAVARETVEEELRRVYRRTVKARQQPKGGIP